MKNQNMTIARMHARPLQITEIDEVAGGVRLTSAQLTASSNGPTVDGVATFDF